MPRKSTKSICDPVGEIEMGKERRRPISASGVSRRRAVLSRREWNGSPAVKPFAASGTFRPPRLNVQRGTAGAWSPKNKALPALVAGQGHEKPAVEAFGLSPDCGPMPSGPERKWHNPMPGRRRVRRFRSQQNASGGALLTSPWRSGGVPATGPGRRAPATPNRQRRRRRFPE